MKPEPKLSDSNYGKLPISFRQRPECPIFTEKIAQIRSNKNKMFFKD
jgi:hypothetical protein